MGNDVATQWYHFAQDPHASPGHPFMRYVSMWVAFNSIYSFEAGRRSHDEWEAEGDWMQIKRFAKSATLQRAHATALGQPASPYARAVRRIRDISQNHSGKLAGILRRDPDSLESILRALYVIRCNLFHGRKRPGDLWEHDTVDAAFVVLEALVRPFVGYQQAAV